MMVFMEAVRESDGEGAWETCAPDLAKAWRVSLRRDGDGVRSWAYKERARAVVALAELGAGHIQPRNVMDLARPSARTVYLP